MPRYSILLFFFSSRRRHTRWTGDWSSDVCSSDLGAQARALARNAVPARHPRGRQHHQHHDPRLNEGDLCHARGGPRIRPLAARDQHPPLDQRHDGPDLQGDDQAEERHLYPEEVIVEIVDRALLVSAESPNETRANPHEGGQTPPVVGVEHATQRRKIQIRLESSPARPHRAETDAEGKQVERRQEPADHHQLDSLRAFFPFLSPRVPRRAAMTRSRPAFFASYIAASALAMSSSGVSPCAGYSAAPTLTLIGPPSNASAATRARIRSATMSAVLSGASMSITTNSSPPYRATLSTPRVVRRRISAIVTSAASPARCPWVSLYCLKRSTSASSTEKVRRSRRDRCTSFARVPIRCRRLYNPVSASVTESRSSSPWLSFSRTRVTRFLNTWDNMPISPLPPTGTSTERSPAATCSATVVRRLSGRTMTSAMSPVMPPIAARRSTSEATVPPPSPPASCRALLGISTTAAQWSAGSRRCVATTSGPSARL